MQVVVQAMHAAMEAARRFLNDGDEHPHLVVCKVDSSAKLEQTVLHLSEHGVRHIVFHEPDLNNSATAVATEPLSGMARKVMSRFKCLDRINFSIKQETP